MTLSKWVWEQGAFYRFLLTMHISNQVLRAFRFSDLILGLAFYPQITMLPTLMQTDSDVIDSSFFIATSANLSIHINVSALIDISAGPAAAV